MANSLLQDGILLVLPSRFEQAIGAAEIFKRLGVEHASASQRASVSRSLAHLRDRKLIVAYEPGVYRQGRGYLWRKT
jgi:molybdopterin biosynthesis enzyme MoaB